MDVQERQIMSGKDLADSDFGIEPVESSGEPQSFNDLLSLKFIRVTVESC